MKYLIVFVVLYEITALAVPSGRLNPEVKSRARRISTGNERRYGIFHANASDIRNYPYVVSVYSKTFDAIVGSGSILNHNWVLVTAFEVDGLEADDLTVRAGSNFSYCEGQEFNVSLIVVNEYYGSQYWSDVALLKTTTKIPYTDSVKRINLGYYTPNPNSTAVISGYGGNEEEDCVLRASTVTILGKSICKQYFSDFDENWLCSSSDTSALSAFDDFGDPLVQNNVLVGIYLGSINDGPDFFLNIVYWKGWIIENIKKYNYN